MSIKFSDFAIRGVDVSQHNGSVDWTKTNCHFAAIRVGYGRVVDTEFAANWAGAKGRVFRIPYWYLDYYSNHDSSSSANGISDEDWGRIQAETCWNALKNDPSGIVFLDIENGNPTYAPPITSVTNRAQTIARAFIERMDALNGKVNGIYKSVGMLNWFGSWFRNRPLWVAWYNEAQTPQSVLSAVSNNGWSGNCLIWQYSETGQVDGVSGKCDLNAWVGTMAQYDAMISGVNIPDSTTPDDEAPTVPAIKTRQVEEKKTTVRLWLRSQPKVSILTGIKVLSADYPLDVLGRSVDKFGNTWVRVGVDQYVAEVYEGNTYLKR